MPRWLLCLAVSACGFAQEPLSLADAVERALRAHPSVEKARAAAAAAGERIAEARGQRWFRLDYAESWQRSNNPVFVFGSLLTQHQFTADNFRLDSLNRPDAINNFQSLVTLDQPIWNGGRTKRAEEAAEAGRAAAQAAVSAAQTSLIHRVAKAYLDASLTGEAVPAAEASVRSAEADRDRARHLRDAGRATDADVLSVEVHLAQMREHLIARQAERKAVQAALNELIGAPAGDVFQLTTPLERDAVPGGPPGERPDVALVRTEVASAEARWKAAKAELFPQLSFRAAFEADRQRFVTQGGANWFTGVTFRWTPFQGGSDRARVRAAGDAVSAARAAEKEVRSRAEVEKTQAEVMVEAAHARVATTESTVAMAEESLRITRDRYTAGLATVTELLRTETAVLESKLRRLSAHHAARVAQLSREAAAGRLTAESEVLR